MRSDSNGVEPGGIWKARRFIEENFGDHISLGAIARAVNVNPTYLSEKFKHVTGIKLVDYVAQTRFEQAKKFLNDGDRPISEIAFAAGFQSLSQFNRVFKKFAGSSPTKYRLKKVAGLGHQLKSGAPSERIRKNALP